MHHLSLLLQEVNWSSATFFSQGEEEQAFMKNIKNIYPKSNSVFLYVMFIFYAALSPSHPSHCKTCQINSHALFLLNDVSDDLTDSLWPSSLPPEGGNFRSKLKSIFSLFLWWHLWIIFKKKQCGYAVVRINWADTVTVGLYKEILFLAQFCNELQLWLWGFAFSCKNKNWNPYEFELAS